MQKQGNGRYIVGIVIGGLLALFALYGLIAGALTGEATNAIGVVIWGGLSALFITLGVRGLRRTNQDDARSPRPGTQDH
jgi:hypothetical protein